MGEPSSAPTRELADRTVPDATYQVVVVGSGYGGSVLAARLAEKGLSVAVLERGREWTPALLPKTLLEASREIRSASSPLGLFDLQKGTDLDVLSGSGLGGTSLINGNVALRAPPEVFESARWPRQLRGENGRRALKDRYAEAERALGAARTPNVLGLSKVQARLRHAERPGLELLIPPLTIDFGRPGGPQEGACTLCGNCITGCSVGAKNAVTKNYLRFAKATKRVEIVTQTEVQFVLPLPGGGWEVHALSRAEGGGEATPAVVRASVVVLAAGSLGSTAILLRSRARGLALGPRIGHHFGGNADRAGYGYNCDVRIGAVGRKHDEVDSPAVGPTIASMTMHVDSRGRSFLIQEGAVPRALLAPTRWLLPAAAVARGEDTDGGWRDEAQEALRVLRDQVAVGDGGALAHTMLMLAMGDDDADGRVILDHEEAPRVVWGALAGKPVFEAMEREMRAIVADLGGTWVPNPNPWRAFGGPPMTVHPLGGAPMGDDVDSGAVDHLGRVFAPDGTAHPWLFVADGAIVPCSLRANPLLTITALAERIAREAGFENAPPAPPKAPPRPAPVPPVGLSFTETMAGWIDTSLTRLVTQEDFLEADRQRRGRNAGTIATLSKLSFRLTVVVDDIDRFIAEAAHEAGGEGYVDGIWGKRQLIERGRFNLLVDAAEPATKLTRYSLAFRTEDGAELTLEGVKRIHDDPGDDSFADATTLYVTLREGWAPQGPILGQGVMRIEGAALLSQLASFRAHRAPTLEASVQALGRFGAFFFGNLWEPFIRPHMSRTPPQE